MTQKVKTLLGAAALLLAIAGASVAYSALREQYSPEIELSGQPGEIPPESAAPGEPVLPDESESGESAPDAPVRTKAPDFMVEDAAGNRVKLSDMEGKPVVLNFWASWCPPCKAEMPEFDLVYSELSDEVTFMMVDLTDGQRETREKGEAYVTEQGFSFPVYFDTEQEAAYTYSIRSIPTTIFIDRDGYIVAGAEGQLDEKTLRHGISLIQEASGLE